ncbi:hypothetical protein ERO13_D11G181750v2 [Gossypium hirsutum]|uniref:Uncharacterized protein n=1 Tax=Gossypium mustelinum TaxID=34275 RepID=A0A5D2SW85_GOSMU|nr:hypothetical protein ERO13_D11G181750v2 [Gossypium hirsutum]TYI56254.1 hypothetical protein E1A91_D11G196600v1 [Gossypium mustelinum]
MTALYLSFNFLNKFHHLHTSFSWPIHFKEESGKGAEPMPMKKIKRDKSLIYTPHPAHLWRSHSQHDVVDQSKGKRTHLFKPTSTFCDKLLN